MQAALFVIGGLLVGATVLSRIRSARWWVRFADFPRVQLAVMLAVVLAAQVATGGVAGVPDAIFVLAVGAALVEQVAQIFPYTPLAPKEVATARRNDDDGAISILISNVLMENRRAGDLLALVRETDPDVVLAVETDAWWSRQLEVLDGDYPHSLKHPQDNYYGMLFFSRLDLRAAEIRFLAEAAIPSVRAQIRLRSGFWITFYGLHPRPPQPREDTHQRDAEILIVGEEIAARGEPSIVAGDLNDVAWSYTTRLFQRVSGMLDPRRGRGTFSTYHARYPIFRWPLDHIFHDACFALVRLERLRSIGSDHFPVFAALRFEPRAEPHQKPPAADADDHREARARIEESRQARRGET